MTPPPRVRPPFAADERTQLVGWLDMQRAIVHWKCEGLSEADARRVVLPTSPLMTVAGLISHMRWTEHCWFEVLFLGAPSEGNPQFLEEPEDADMRVEGVTLARLLDDYRLQCERSNEIVAAHSLDDVGKHPDFRSAAASLRWMLIHMVEETARHAGQLDTVRELLDGTKGYY
ncbi:MAG: DinB family protein [Nonomuraea sp.]|nr:DinB family protein [Nonomuraea sp.]NUP63751.1 DinB family protein [Nonomuraea sp.]NUP79173.1 DinB family protein [Nonomuraea sp.]NUS05424.1 DinB family protein [Nonomuraea sp.]NUT42315.1 DinB family protein [Thermoactinospora sp.]